MPSEKKRKMIMLDRQPMISLPLEWVKFWKMKKGDIIPIFYDSVLIVIPPNHPNKEIIEEKVRNFLIDTK